MKTSRAFFVSGGSRIAPDRERGAALIVALLFLVILAMLGVSSLTSTTLEERMSGNARDQNIAMQAAEAALRDAEKDLTSAGSRIAVANFVALCTAALCNEGQPLANLDNPLKSAFYGQFTGATATVPGVAQQPRYMLELLTAIPPQTAPVPPAGTTWRNFRVTAKGYGRNANTIVILQTVFQTNL